MERSVNSFIGAKPRSQSDISYLKLHQQHSERYPPSYHPTSPTKNHPQCLLSSARSFLRPSVRHWPSYPPLPSAGSTAIANTFPARPMWPFYTAGAIIFYGVSSFATVLANSAPTALQNRSSKHIY